MDMAIPGDKYVSRAGYKIEGALRDLQVDPAGWVCADLGSNIGGFVDCLLQHGAAKVYAVDTGYGTLAWKLRKDSRVVVMERTNAMHATLPETVDLVTIDVAWTKQQRILPAAAGMINAGGRVLTLVKPHYEADKGLLVRGVLPPEHLEGVVEEVRRQVDEMGWRAVGECPSPVPGAGGNREVWLLLEHPT
jgi:23S rRNA (cytidine1920-2'-O)/16S rRNA (cytidine1409-2'-O)-methyltransferase